MMTKADQRVADIISLLGQLWEKRAAQQYYTVPNRFANFFNCDVCDTSTGGELTPLLFCEDNDLLDHLRLALERDEPSAIN